jgi:hypothetical protein
LAFAVACTAFGIFAFTSDANPDADSPMQKVVGMLFWLFAAFAAGIAALIGICVWAAARNRRVRS